MASLTPPPASQAVGPTSAGALLPLSMVPVGLPRVITCIHGPDAGELEREGVLSGSVVLVAARTPLGGPLVLEVGRSRLAISARVAAQVETRPFTAADESSR